ncbi:MFS transporter [Tistrella bauzanensis]|uniref:MFS transporter n=1 Tax=Tistrella TaxID=171436 RepID=UPI0031F67FBD
MLFVYFAAGILGAPGWLWLSTRIGKHRAWSLAMLLAATGFLPAALLGTGDLPVFLAICIVTGLTLGADLALPNAMQADVIDLDRLDSGRERAGLFFALWGFATKASLALGVGLAFPLLEAAGFNPAISTAPAAAGATVPGLWALALIYGALPVPFKILAVILVRRFPLDRATQTGIAGRIALAGGHAGHATATATPSAGTKSCAASSATPEAPSSRSRPSSPSLDAVR